MTAPTEPTEEARAIAERLAEAIFYRDGLYLTQERAVTRIALALDAFRREGVEQAEKERDEREASYSLLRQQWDEQHGRIAFLEAELARVREERDAAYAIRDAGWEQTEGVIKERDALRARLSTERLEKVADAIVEALMGSLRPAPSMTAVILAVLQRELGKEK